MRIPVRVRYETKNEQCGIVEDVCCPTCGQVTHFYKIKNTTTVKLIVIPIFKTTNVAALVCPKCQSTFKVNKNELSKIESNIHVLNAISNVKKEEREKAQSIKDKYSVGFSEKNQIVAMVLAAFFTTFGAPFFYIGKPIYGILCFLISLLSCIFQIFPAIILVSLSGFVFAYFISLGKVRDGKGKYIASKKQQVLFTQSTDEIV